MKIIERSYDQLEIRPRLWLFWLIFGLGFLIGGLAVFFTMGQSTTLVCERMETSQPVCWITRDFMGREISREPLEALRGAYVDSSTDSDGDTTYRVVLQTSSGDIPLTKVWSSGYNNKQEIAAKVNAYTNSESALDLDIAQSGSTGLIMGGIFAGIGTLSLFIASQSIFTAWYFDRSSMTLTHHRESIFSKGDLTWGLNEIKEAIVTGHYDSDGDRTYRIELVTTMEEHIPLTSWWSSGYRRKQATADRINQFISGTY